MFVGFDSRDIAPAASWPSIRMVGQPHSPMSKGVESPLLAAAMCFCQLPAKAYHFVCTVDLLFVSNATFERIRSELQSRIAHATTKSTTASDPDGDAATNKSVASAGAEFENQSSQKPIPGLDNNVANCPVNKSSIPKVQLILQATHTHSGPATRAIFGGSANDDYVLFLEQTVVKTCLGAYDDMTKRAQTVASTTGSSTTSPFSFHCGEVWGWWWGGGGVYILSMD